MKIAVGADHAGFELKKDVLQALRDEGHEAIDFGTDSAEPVDYPDYAKAVCLAIRNGEAERGILLCGSGAGVAVAANKMRGIRAALCHDIYTAHQAVEHDNINVMCMGPRVIGPSLALDLVHAWVTASFTGAERHRRRLAKIDEIEKTEACY